MKRVILLCVLFLSFFGCEPTPQPAPKPPKQQQKLPKQQPQPQADGAYVTATLPCKCGDFLVYVPDSCPCFGKDQYPDLARDLENLNAWAQAHSLSGGKRVVGKYVVLTLECGCKLQVYVPGSSGCLEAKSPDLAALLRAVYDTAKRHEQKP